MQMFTNHFEESKMFRLADAFEQAGEGSRKGGDRQLEHTVTLQGHTIQAALGRFPGIKPANTRDNKACTSRPH